VPQKVDVEPFLLREINAGSGFFSLLTYTSPAIRELLSHMARFQYRFLKGLSSLLSSIGSEPSCKGVCRKLAGADLPTLNGRQDVEDESVDEIRIERHLRLHRLIRPFGSIQRLDTAQHCGPISGESGRERRHPSESGQGQLASFGAAVTGDKHSSSFVHHCQSPGNVLSCPGKALHSCDPMSLKTIQRPVHVALAKSKRAYFGMRAF
jgi:hypothetical protein